MAFIPDEDPDCSYHQASYSDEGTPLFKLFYEVRECINDHQLFDLLEQMTPFQVRLAIKRIIKKRGL